MRVCVCPHRLHPVDNNWHMEKARGKNWLFKNKIPNNETRTKKYHANKETTRNLRTK